MDTSYAGSHGKAAALVKWCLPCTHPPLPCVISDESHTFAWLMNDSQWSAACINPNDDTHTGKFKENSNYW